MRIASQSTTAAASHSTTSLAIWIPVVLIVISLAVMAIFVRVACRRWQKPSSREKQQQSYDFAIEENCTQSKISTAGSPAMSGASTLISQAEGETSPVLPAYPIDPSRLEQALPALPARCRISSCSKPSLWARCCMIASLRPSSWTLAGDPDVLQPPTAESRSFDSGARVPNDRDARIRNIEVRRALIDSGLLLGPPRFNRDGSRNTSAWNNPRATAEEILTEEEQQHAQDRRERRRRRGDRRQRRRETMDLEQGLGLPTYSVVLSEGEALLESGDQPALAR
ncbi:hypothetical protein ACM66B_001798 [Microbotryomycetes sp. NB124-2]